MREDGRGLGYAGVVRGFVTAPAAVVKPTLWGVWWYVVIQPAGGQGAGAGER